MTLCKILCSFQSFFNVFHLYDYQAFRFQRVVGRASCISNYFYRCILHLDNMPYQHMVAKHGELKVATGDNHRAKHQPRVVRCFTPIPTGYSDESLLPELRIYAHAKADTVLVRFSLSGAIVFPQEDDLFEFSLINNRYRLRGMGESHVLRMYCSMCQPY